ncbi:MAG: hypothetical protein D3916_09990 [Candidatus Electrothrix sp. MAN1_4]|nr:hypothetical protein [Candidatus Electrothrix sp. MAN1_4]
MELLQSLKEIDRLFHAGDLSDAYEFFFNLCSENNYSDYQPHASMIVARKATYDKQRIAGIFKSEEKKIHENEIAYDFQECLRLFRKEYFSRKTSVQDDKEIIGPDVGPSQFKVDYLSLESPVQDEGESIAHDITLSPSKEKDELFFEESPVQDDRELTELKYEDSIQKNTDQENIENISEQDKSTITKSIKVIEQKYVNGIYSKAYKDLHRLCLEEQEAKQFLGPATVILSQYRDLEHNIMSGSIALSQQAVKKQHINITFLTLLRSMKQHYNLQGSIYEREAIRMRGQLGILRGSLMRVEDELINCSSQDKEEILKEIFTIVKQMLPSFVRLVKLFRSLKVYE